MPRNFPTAIQGELSKRLGSEPIIILEIEWEDGTWIAYSDRALNGAAYPIPSLTEVSNFNSTVIITGGSDSQDVSVTLDDIDGSLKKLISEKDIHLRPARLYLCFQGLPFESKSLLFEGVINSPIEWDEQSRSLKLEIFSKLEDSEAGFTMEDGDFLDVLPAQRNQGWPLSFGETCNIKSVPVTTSRVGFLTEGVGVADPTIEERLCQAYHLLCPDPTDEIPSDHSRLSAIEEWLLAAQSSTLPIPWISYGAVQPPGIETFLGSNGAANANKEDRLPDQTCLVRRFNEICDILVQRQEENKHVKTSFQIEGGESFQSDGLIRIKIDEVEFEGFMVGDTFFVSQIFHPDSEAIDNPPCKFIDDARIGYRLRLDEELSLPLTVEDCENPPTTLIPDVAEGAGASWDYYNEFESGNFIWLNPGSKVTLVEDSPVVHIVSLLPGTVNRVSAYRTYGDVTLLSEVPPERYSLFTTDYGGYDVVELHVNRALSSIDGEKWGDDIYVSFTSSVGPNPVDVIEYLANKYTDYTLDPATSAAVRISMANYPTNFSVKGRVSTLGLIKDIAYQSRCAVFIRDNVMFLTYLSQEPTSVVTMTETDILSGSFAFYHTQTEDLKTKHTIKWSDTEAGLNQLDDTEFEFSLKNNVPKYGSIEETKDYYTQNTFSTIEKSSTFWMIRDSNTWRHVRFKTAMTHLNLEVFDCVTIDIEQFPNTKVVIESADYDVDNNTIAFTAWTPILSGTETGYFWAWPALQTAAAVFPLVESVLEAGDGFDFSVVPPIGHPLRAGFTPGQGISQTSGDRNPSDLDDEFPVLTCKISVDHELLQELEPDLKVFEPLAQSNFSDRLRDQETNNLTDGNGISYSMESDEDSGCCAAPGGGCTYKVVVTYVTPFSVGQGGGDCGGGPCDCVPNPCGQPCTGLVHTVCHTFGASFSAAQFAGLKSAEVGECKSGCCGVTGVYLVSDPVSCPGNGAAGECFDTSGDSEGEINQPDLIAGDLVPGSPADIAAREADTPGGGQATVFF